MSSPAALDDAQAVKCELVAEFIRSSGTLRLRVIGWSMLPVIWPGDTLVIEHVNSDAVSEGDIVLFGRDRRLFAHRVVKKPGTAGDSRILTRGDASPRPDPPVSDGDLLGRVAFILRNGKRIEPRRTPRATERAVAALLRSSDIAARLVTGVHGMCQSSQD
jgi:signal peptidase I